MGHHGRHSPATYHHHPGCREASVQGRAGLHPRCSLPLKTLIPSYLQLFQTPPSFNIQLSHPSPRPPLCLQPASPRCRSWLCSWILQRPLLHRGKQPGALCFIFLLIPASNALHWISLSCRLETSQANPITLGSLLAVRVISSSGIKKP